MKLYVMYVNFVIKQFDISNKALQDEAPRIHEQGRLMSRLIRELLQMFVKPAALKNKTVDEVDFKIQKCNIMEDKDVFVGAEVRQFLEANQFSSKNKKKFFKSVKRFLTTACTYLLKNLPLKEPFIKHAAVANISYRDDATFRSLEFFIDRYPIILSDGLTKDVLDSEMRSYKQCDLPTFSKETPMDVRWKELLKLKDECGNILLPHLPKVMVRILSIPHSNASCERIFSVVRKNRTDFRANMETETLQSLLILKQTGGECFNRKFTPEVITACKKATQEHLNS